MRIELDASSGMDDIFKLKAQSTIRREASNTIDEFNLSSSLNANCKPENAADLVDALASVKNVGKLKQQLTQTHKRVSTLHTPVHRAAVERIERTVAYSEAKKKVGFWDEIVRQNRLADTLHFPLKRRDDFEQNDGVVEGTLNSVCQRFTPRTELEIECEKVLKGSKNTLRAEEEYTEVEKEALKAMSLEEAQKRRNELCKVRALISYKTAQNKRIRSIKSKRFHRMAKKERRKVVEKEVAQLMRGNDPEAAAEKLRLLEMDRIAERSTLKHRGTGQWAKHIRQLAQKDPKLREALQNQLRLGKELAEKVFVSAQKSDDDSSDDEEPDATDDNAQNRGKSIGGTGSAGVKVDLTPKLAAIVDPTNRNAAGEVIDSDDDDDADQQDALISEAFADDDVIDQETVQAMMTSPTGDDDRSLADQSAADQMPGWNNWVGPGLVEKQRSKLKKKLAYEEKRAKNRKIGRKKSVLINRAANESIRPYQVKQVPFPYSKTKLFEETVAQPLGREWNTSTGYSMLIRPTVTTKLGHVIEPISVDHVKGYKKHDHMLNIVSE